MVVDGFFVNSEVCFEGEVYCVEESLGWWGGSLVVYEVRVVDEVESSDVRRLEKFMIMMGGYCLKFSE